jgi:predicted AlkP superfamily pyrophosphatase or phosphodiesterase
MVGYTMRVPHSGRPERLLNALKWDERIDPQIWQPHDTLFEIAMAQGISVSHVSGKRYENTGFTRAALRGGRYRGANTLTELVAETIESLKSDQSFVYLYLNDVDEASHGEGFGSEKFLTAMRKVDSLIEQLTTSLPKGTRLWVTSDHGMINRGEYCVLGKENHLLEDVSLLGGEPRSRYLYVEPSQIEKVHSRWRDFFGSQVEIFSRHEALTRGLFGPTVLDQAIERIGDLIVVAQGDLILVEPDREALQLAMVGHHGGLTADESEIPLLRFTA